MQSGTTAAENWAITPEQAVSFALMSRYGPASGDWARLHDREHARGGAELLWRVSHSYATDMGLRYLIGCSSLNSKDPAEGWQCIRSLKQ